MLILSRKTGESILVGDDIEIIISEIRNGSVRIGIEAPRSYPIYRKEIYDQILEENKLASNSDVNNFDKLHKVLKKGE